MKQLVGTIGYNDKHLLTATCSGTIYDDLSKENKQFVLMFFLDYGSEYSVYCSSMRNSYSRRSFI